MKLFVIMLFLLTSVLRTRAATNAAANIPQEQLFMEAVLLSSQGFYPEAEVRLKHLLELQPEQPTVRELLREVQLRRIQREQDPVGILKQKLAAISFPTVQFRDANPEDVIDFIRQETGKLAADKTEINFVWQVPRGALVSPITLNLKNVPLTEILNYLAQVTGLRYRVDAYAVVIYKPEPPLPPNVKPE